MTFSKSASFKNFHIKLKFINLNLINLYSNQVFDSRMQYYICDVTGQNHVLEENLSFTTNLLLSKLYMEINFL